VVLVAAATALGYYWTTRAGSHKQERVAAVSVPTAIADFGPVRAAIRATGTLTAQKSASLTAPRILGSRSGFNRGGDAGFAGPPGGGGGGGGGLDFNLTLLTLAKAGTRVHAGDVVAQFDTQNQLQRLDDYRDSVVQMENSLKSLMATTAAAKEAFLQQVRSANADWKKAELDLETAPIRSEIDREKYKLAVEEMQTTYKALDKQAAFLDESQRAQIHAAELNLAQARIELQRAEANVRRMTIKSPIDGIVVMASIVRNGEFGQIREGDQVNAGQPFLSIVDPGSMALDASINQVDSERLRLGMRAEVRLDAYPDIDLPGAVIGLGAMSKASVFRARYVGEMPVRVRVERLDARLIPDLTGSAEIVLGEEKPTVTVPRGAVFEEDGGAFVYCKQGEGWTKRPVHTGTENFTTAAIESGLEKGEVVALAKPW
jgi:HlyD family secretion protein